MMIECPRCGFAQPKDQYCASCGLNIDQYRAPAKSLFTRFVQNPNLHLALIGISIVLVIGWIFYSQRGLVGKEMSHLLDLPVSSKNAGDPNDERNEQQKQAAQAAAREAAQPEPTAAPAPPAPTPEAMGGAKAASMEDAAAGAVAGADPATAAEPAAATAAASTGPKTKLEVSFWEIPRDALATISAGGEKTGEGNGGRALFFAQGAKFLEGLQSQTQSVAAPKNSALNTGSQIMYETPPTVAETFQFLMQIEVTKVEGKEVTVRWENNLILPQGSEPPVGPPNLAETTLLGTSALPPAGVIVLVIEPSNRAPNEQYVTKAGPGPWNIFNSQEFRGGLTDWIAVIQLK